MPSSSIVLPSKDGKYPDKWCLTIHRSIARLIHFRKLLIRFIFIAYKTITYFSISFASGVDAKLFTRFTKEELSLLMVHLRIPTEDFVDGSRHRFKTETVLIVSLAKIATGMPWYYLVRLWFGGNPDHWCTAFAWFVDHLFVTLYNKISGGSMGQWSG